MQPRGVKLVERLVEIVRAPAAHAGERILDLLADLLVLAEEAVRQPRFARDQRAADEELRGLLRLDAAEIDQPRARSPARGRAPARARAPARLSRSSAARCSGSGRGARRARAPTPGLMPARVRAKSCEVSTISPAMIHAGCCTFGVGGRAARALLRALVEVRAGEEGHQAIARGLVGVAPLVAARSARAGRRGRRGGAACRAALFGRAGAPARPWRRRAGDKCRATRAAARARGSSPSQSGAAHCRSGAAPAAARRARFSAG